MTPENRRLWDKALETVDRYGMIQQGDLVAVGVSGGADSVALLDFLFLLSREFPIRLLVCHLNHGLRGKEADRDEAFTKALAEGYGLPSRVRRVDAAEYAKERRRSVEEAGRELRYAFLRDCAGEDGKIATAHTLSDSMETLLINLCRSIAVCNYSDAGCILPAGNRFYGERSWDSGNSLGIAGRCAAQVET